MTENELLEEMAALLSVPDRQPGDVDARQLAKISRVDVNTARRLLTEKEAAGELTSLLVRNYTGMTIRVWRRKENK